MDRNQHKAALFKVSSALLLSAVLTACGTPASNYSVEPTSRMKILGPAAGFRLDRLPSDWVTTGDARSLYRQSSLVVRDSVPALRFTGSTENYGLIRKTRAVLLATPYLSWAWNMQHPNQDRHPVSLVVGFLGGKPTSKKSFQPPVEWLVTDSLPHDRLLVLDWSGTALKRGTLSHLPTHPGLARYAVRGGPLNTSAWWLDTVDLADLYARAWPGDDRGRTRVAFVGLLAEASRSRAAALISGIVLSR